MKKQLLSAVLVLALMIAFVPSASAAAGFSDVPESSWAVGEISSATGYGLMEGKGGGVFGYGENVTRAEFATMLCRMFGWNLIKPIKASFTDVGSENWYYEYVETAYANDVVDSGGAFRPKTAITREEMAVMLVRALGYKSLASQVASYGNPFSDVRDHVGYLIIAYDIGMIKGDGNGHFLPKDTAKREAAAAMLVRVYEKYKSDTDWIHGFYAFSSYGQRALTTDMDAVSLGWSTMTWDAAGGAKLNTSSAGGNEWSIPSEYNLITNYLDSNKTKAHLSVFMDTSKSVTRADGTSSNTLRELLASAQSRTQAVTAIVEEATHTYELIGKSPYSGVTIDFEGLYYKDQSNFTAFLTELSKELKNRNMTLYVAVHTALPTGQYFDGYDYRAIGNLADKVILMAHDYSPSNLSGYTGTKWHENAAVTPFAQVYFALRTITDAKTGVEDTSKVVLAISFSAVAWEIDGSGNLVSATPEYPTTGRVYQRMQQSDSVTGYSDTYRNAHMTYTTEDNRSIFLWYENERSVGDKLDLAKLFGVTDVSVWRLGLVPDYNGYNVWSVIK